MLDDQITEVVVQQPQVIMTVGELLILCVGFYIVVLCVKRLAKLYEDITKGDQY